MTLDYEFTVLVKLKYAFISLLAIKLFEWGVKNFSQSIDIMQTSYNQCLTCMTLLTQKLKLGEKSQFRV